MLQYKDISIIYDYIYKSVSAFIIMLIRFSIIYS